MATAPALNVRDTIALDEVIVAAEHYDGARPDPFEQDRIVRDLEEGEITVHTYCVRMAAHHLALLAWAESLER